MGTLRPTRVGVLALGAVIAAAALLGNAVGATVEAGGGRLAFLRGTINTSPCGAIYTMSPGGGAPRPFTALRQPVCFPSWSPDGSKVAFNFVSGKTGIYTVHADGSHLQRVTAGGTDYHPTWSADGSALVFTRAFNLYEVKTAGGRARALTHITTPGVSAAAPAWSPDGRHIAFQLAGSRAALVVLDLGSGTLTPLGVGGSPSWSPDGKKIVFAAPGGLKIAGLDGRTVRTLVQGDGPSWSPDGRKIAYWWRTSGAGPRSAVYVVNVDGTGKQQVSTGPYDATPTWLPH